MKRYKSIHMVRMEHLNHHANLYAGQGIEWMMESTFIAACLAHGDAAGLVFKNTHQFNFMKSVQLGDIIGYESVVVRTGRTSMTMRVGMVNEMTGELMAEGYATYVTIDPETRKPLAHSVVLDETTDPEELKWRETADGFFGR